MYQDTRKQPTYAPGSRKEYHLRRWSPGTLQSRAAHLGESTTSGCIELVPQRCVCTITPQDKQHIPDFDWRPLVLLLENGPMPRWSCNVVPTTHPGLTHVLMRSARGVLRASNEKLLHHTRLADATRCFIPGRVWKSPCSSETCGIAVSMQ